MLSATGLIARTSEDAVERWENRSASNGRAKDDQIVSMFRTSTRSSYGLVTSAGRLVLAHVVELPKVSADGPLSVTGGVKAEELLGMTENTDPIRGERVIAAIDMPSTDDGGQLVPLALGTRNGVVKRWNRESPTTMDSWSVIDLKDDDEVLAAAEARDEDRLVFVSTDSSLLTFEAKNVRPQGRTAGGMAGIRLAALGPGTARALSILGLRTDLELRRRREWTVLRFRSRGVDGCRRFRSVAWH